MGVNTSRSRYTDDPTIYGNELWNANFKKLEAFNPSEYARLMDPGDMGRNVGIRLVYRMARDVSYQNLLGLNVLTMRI